MAELVALAVGNAADRRRLAAQASTDSLTGLANHRTFQERLRAEAARAVRRGSPLSLMLIDLDRFKQVNDSLGHPEGDGVLVAVAQRMRSAARASDLVARVGGEEFALLLPDTRSDETMVVAERLRSQVAAGPVGPIDHLTISIGVCDLDAAGGDPGDLYGHADAALYRAKRLGRNMSLCWSADPPGA
jgi:diguanylate cyclase (GGDEF)-like protein